jgi:uncharacterized protein YlxW (UPF0749 family)
MRYTIALILTFLFAVSATPVFSCAPGQEPAKERAANLRAQLMQVQSQQEDLQTRLRQLDEDMKPENIEKGLAGVGSTRPEDLREHRRRQMEIEKTSVQARLNILTTSRTRLETRLAQADNDAYLESAGLNPNGTPRATGPGPSADENAATIVSQPPTGRRRARTTKSKSPRPRARRTKRTEARP